MFTKIDKKILVILAVAVIAILLLAFAGYKYILSPEPKVQNSTGGEQTENKEPKNNTPQFQLAPDGVQVQGNGDGFTVCFDKCGDGVCDKPDPKCDVKKDLNCICPETPQECPGDCK